MEPYDRAGKWYINIPQSLAGRRVRISLTKRYGARTRAEARKAARRLMDELRDNKLGIEKPRLLSEAVLEWLDNEMQDLKYTERYESHARALTPHIKGRTFDEVVETVRAVKQGMQREGCKNATINRRLAVLRRALRLAYTKWRWIKAPIHEQVTLLPEKNQRHVYLTQKQVRELAAACPNRDAGAMVMVAAWTGLRRSELHRLNSCPDRYLVEADHGLEIRLGTETKTGRPRTVPVAAAIHEIVKRMPLPVTDQTLRVSWDVARIRTGQTQVKFHDLRHTFASWLAGNGAEAVDIRDILGHTDLRTTSRYTHLIGRRLHDVVTGIEEESE